MMDKNEAIKLAHFGNSTKLCRLLKEWVDYLYNRGYIIITPEEIKKINAMTVLASIHGMNPFEGGQE